MDTGANDSLFDLSGAGTYALLGMTGSGKNVLIKTEIINFLLNGGTFRKMIVVGRTGSFSGDYDEIKKLSRIVTVSVTGVSVDKLEGKEEEREKGGKEEDEEEEDYYPIEELVIYENSGKTSNGNPTPGFFYYQDMIESTNKDLTFLKQLDDEDGGNRTEQFIDDNAYCIILNDATGDTDSTSQYGMFPSMATYARHFGWYLIACQQSDSSLGPTLLRNVNQVLLFTYDKKCMEKIRKYIKCDTKDDLIQSWLSQQSYRFVLIIKRWKGDTPVPGHVYFFEPVDAEDRGSYRHYKEQGQQSNEKAIHFILPGDG